MKDCKLLSPSRWKVSVVQIVDTSVAGKNTMVMIVMPLTMLLSCA